MERSPVSTSAMIGTAVQSVVLQANGARDAGDENWHALPHLYL
jgi:hypothetical protein